jgi:hypothetical protein
VKRLSWIFFFIMTLVAFVFIYPNYSDYRSQSQISTWRMILQSCKVEKDKTVQGCLIWAKVAFLKDSRIGFLKILDSSVIIVGKKYGQLVVFTVSKKSDKFEITCDGYPEKKVKPNCESPKPHL